MASIPLLLPSIQFYGCPETGNLLICENTQQLKSVPSGESGNNERVPRPFLVRLCRCQTLTTSRTDVPNISEKTQFERDTDVFGTNSSVFHNLCTKDLTTKGLTSSTTLR